MQLKRTLNFKQFTQIISTSYYIILDNGFVIVDLKLP